MAAYIIAAIDVTDPEGYRGYTSRVPGLVERFGGRFIIRGGRAETLEGSAPTRLVVLEFPDVERARAFYAAPAYQELIPLRHANARTSFLTLVEGVT
jgi:uncharacterized protein (DUF1330 family)